MAYTFTPDLVTGNNMIDSQHKELIKAIDDLLNACNGGKGRAQLEPTLKFLSDYTNKHFGDEEKLQQQYKYPDCVNHKKLHDGFKQSVRILGDELRKDGPTVPLVGKVNAQIGGWLITHIKREDVKVAAHVKAAGG
ncbi:MAG: hemerythrin family protein [Oscillospiraceae bacterium]|jgi:hemerythrin|nr:hemerythrin family protein [Oscillospiraceae bacterium]